jgi:hypothetical protein
MRLHKCLHVIRCTYNFDTETFSNLKNVQYESCLEFQNLQLRIHCTYGSDTKTSLRQKKVLDTKKMLKFSKIKVLLYKIN